MLNLSATLRWHSGVASIHTATKTCFVGSITGHLDPLFSSGRNPVTTTTITSESNVHLFKRKWLLNSSAWYRRFTASKNLSFLTKFLLLRHLNTAIIFSGNPEYKRENVSSTLSKKQPNNIKRKRFRPPLSKTAELYKTKGRMGTTTLGPCLSINTQKDFPVWPTWSCKWKALC